MSSLKSAALAIFFSAAADLPKHSCRSGVFAHDTALKMIASIGPF